jgi:signal transduction histidine kinase
LRSLSAKLQSAREDEGARIAREIHDELGSALTSLKWDLEGLGNLLSETGTAQIASLQEKIAAMMRLTDSTVNMVRRIASQLRPCILDPGLNRAIEREAQQFQAQTGIHCECEGSLENVDLTEEQSIAIFRIFQEALTNIRRHAQATKVHVTITEEVGEFILTICDNGKGIRKSDKSAPQSLGLLGMLERAQLIRGDLKIMGIEGKGTVITLRMPTYGNEETSSHHPQP